MYKTREAGRRNLGESNSIEVSSPRMRAPEGVTQVWETAQSFLSCEDSKVERLVFPLAL